MVKSTAMNKKEAATYLGKSVRTIERLTSSGRLSATYKPGTTGDEAVYDEDELRRFKEQMESAPNRIRPTVLPPSGDGADTSADMTALAPAGLSGLGERLTAALEALQIRVAGPRPMVTVENKLLLSLVEASALSGMSVFALREAVKSGKLPVQKGIGRGLGKVKRADLENYIEKL